MQEDPNKITYFAQTNSRGKEVPFGIKRKDRARHMYVIGKTGMGKSTLLENMAIQDIRNGEGMAFIDPHGSTADRIMEYVPEHRIKDVVYFAPFDMDYPVAFNVMEDVGYDKRHLVVSGLLAAFRKIWVDAWSARMEYILSNTLLALLEYEGSTLLDVNRMLINKAFRKKVVENVTDPIVKSFWVDEFANYTDRYTQDATPAIQNKVGQFTSNPLIRNIVGQAKSSFDIRKLMDEKKILIMNLSKGRVGEVNATLLGSMLVTKIYLAAMSRADVPANVLNALPNFYFYVDEFQNFANESFSDILSEARKYKLNLLIAHQYVEQMEEEVRDAVFGNVGTTVAFRVGPFDAETLETIFSPQFTQTDLVNLGFAQIYLTLMIDGVGSPPFSATTLPPFDPPPSKYVDQVIENSRREFGKPRAEVEDTIKKWQESDPVVQEPPKPKKSYGAASKPTPTTSPSRPVVQQPRENRPAPVAHHQQEEHKPPQHEAPPLEGSLSLRDALARVTRTKEASEPPAPKPASKPAPRPITPDPSIDLRAALQNVAPQTAKKDEPAGLPEDVLRSMLAVDEGENTAA
ncbi:MAG TPA: type IV secretion system DNA-binding domain-containing protein [Candidatus Paceibacterota bacterium]|nr:type IV secretion system DNA-binding domain-containing protein [Candidatus Paceibacterota bacterium]